MGSGAERLTGAGFKYVDNEFRDRLALRYTPVMDLAVGIPMPGSPSHSGSSHLASKT